MASASTRRLDPEYFQKRYLADQALVQSRPADFQSFARLGLKVDGSAFYPSIEEYYGTGELPFLRVADVDSVIDFENCLRIPSELCDRFPTLARVYDGDIVLTKGGSVARVGLVTQEAAASRDLIFLNSNILQSRDRAFLYLYAQTEFFNRILVRSSSQTAQPHLTITLVRDLPVLQAGEELKSLCAQMIEQVYLARAAAISKAKLAEEILTLAIGLAGWNPPETIGYSAKSSEVSGAGRLDSQYFAPRVAELIKRLGSGGRRVAEVAPARLERFVPSGRGSFRYMEISNVHSDGTAATEEIPLSDAPSRATWYVRKGDVVTSTVRPNRRLSALVSPAQDGCVASSGFVVLQPKAVSAEVLLTYLRLPIVCELMDLHTSASLYPAISQTDLLGLPFPLISSAAQGHIVAAVREAQAARVEAHYLLDRAKHAVGIAIEESEAAALKYLKEK